MPIDFAAVLALKAAIWPRLFQRQHVVGVGVGYKITQDGMTDEPALMINVERKLPKSQLSEADIIPSQIASIRTDVVETGLMRAFRIRRRRIRTFIPAGISLGHPKVTSGTFGCLVRRGNEIFILSNNHVLANMNQANKGSPIIQPGRVDGGHRKDVIATLEDYVPLVFEKTRSVQPLKVSKAAWLDRLNDFRPGQQT